MNYSLKWREWRMVVRKTSIYFVLKPGDATGKRICFLLFRSSLIHSSMQFSTEIPCSYHELFFQQKRSAGSQTLDNHLGQEAITIINTLCILQNESCCSKGKRDLLIIDRQWWFSNCIFNKLSNKLYWTIRMHFMEIYKGSCFNMTRSEHITQNQKYKRETDEQPSLPADKPKRFISHLKVVFVFLPGRTFSWAVTWISFKVMCPHHIAPGHYY